MAKSVTVHLFKRRAMKYYFINVEMSAGRQAGFNVTFRKESRLVKVILRCINKKAAGFYQQLSVNGVSKFTSY
ncbi:MAG: hypothetical protein IPP43_08090 [Chitinophagaceae bacterium]|nr:hypothetical protein [Chitinophagaceae bacterium]